MSELELDFISDKSEIALLSKGEIDDDERIGFVDFF